MKIKNVQQNTEEWYRARLGIPTASSFDKIITKGGKKSGQWYDYMYRLIYERIYRRGSNTNEMTPWMSRGKMLEPAAAEHYSRLFKEDLDVVGFITTDDARLGCSPDRIVNRTPDVAVEIKCPAPWRHIQYTALGPGEDYYAQMQGQMYVGEFRAVEFFSYCPGMPCVKSVMIRNEKFIKNMADLLEEFCNELDRREESARKLGIYEALPENFLDPGGGIDP